MAGGGDSASGGGGGGKGKGKGTGKTVPPQRSQAPKRLDSKGGGRKGGRGGKAGRGGGGGGRKGGKFGNKRRGGQPKKQAFTRQERKVSSGQHVIVTTTPSGTHTSVFSEKQALRKARKAERPHAGLLENAKVQHACPTPVTTPL